MNAIAAALYSTLTSGTALTALLAGTTAVYNGQAPDDAALPYVVFSKQGGGPENIDPSDRRNLIYFVRGYALTAKAAGDIDTQVDTLLHKKNLSVSGKTVIWTARETDLEMVENPPDDVPVYMAGGLYRIRLT